MSATMIGDTLDDTVPLRHMLVEQLKQKRVICSPAVEDAFRRVPRHLFLPCLAVEQAYQDQAVPTKQLDGEIVSSSSQPAIMAVMLEQLDVQPGHNVLEIGAGTGYNAALLAHIVGPTGTVTTIDIDDDIVQDARHNLARAHIPGVNVICGDGAYGYQAQAPYDRIILTVSAWDILPAWYNQLHANARLVLPLSLHGTQKSIAFTRDQDHLVSSSLADCGFMRLRGAFTGPEQRVCLPSFPHTHIETYTQQYVDVHTVADVLSGAFTEYEMPISVSLLDLFGPLWLWLALHGYTPITFLTNTTAVSDNPLPTLFSSTGANAEEHTMGFLVGNSVFVWTHSIQDHEHSMVIDWTTPFPLRVRCYNPQQAVLEELKRTINLWEHHGQPKSQDLRIRAYPYDVAFVLDEGTFLIRKKWMNIVMSWNVISPKPT